MLSLSMEKEGKELLVCFISHNECIDFGGNTFDLELLKMTPLITALEKLSTYKRLRQWTPQQSIFKLIIMLCLPEMKQVLETARLLELNQKDISEAACYFAMKGKIIELAILLMVAREKSLGPVCAYGFENHSSSETAITFRQYVRRELSGLLDLGFCLMGRKDPELVRLDDLCEEREQAMLPTLPLLDVFERAGAAIEVYLQSRPDGVVEEQVVQDMERLFADAGYKLKSEDINLSSTAHSASDKVLLDQQDHPVQVSKDNHVERTEGVLK